MALSLLVASPNTGLNSGEDSKLRAATSTQRYGESDGLYCRVHRSDEAHKEKGTKELQLAWWHNAGMLTEVK